jgi:hypothetical protein
MSCENTRFEGEKTSAHKGDGKLFANHYIF